MYTEKQLNGFFDAVESLKKYRRADLEDERGRNILKELYTDLLPNDYILKKSLKENTTFLIGRKGTGKSTIFLRLEQELRDKKGYLPCYLDVKTIYESSQTKLAAIDGIDNYLSSDLIEKYLIERAFLQSTLSQILKEVSNKFDSLYQVFLETLGLSKVEEVKEKLLEIINNIEDNRYLQKIEVPILKKIETINKKSEECGSEDTKSMKGFGIDGGIDKEGIKIGLKADTGIDSKITSKNINESDVSFSSVFLQVFQIKDVISVIKDTLSMLKIKHIYILLDDFSEIEDDSIRAFVDVILAPLNNWSEEFIKFKIAAYPNRIYYGKIDPGKVDLINLDFYNLYSEFDRDKMESNAVDFTKRILSKRFDKFLQTPIETFFDTSKNSMEDYYLLLFQTSMNVPRILGYILSYCYQSRINFNHKINKSDIESASEKYFTEKILPFFETSTHSLISFQEKVSILQLKNLLKKFVEKSNEIRKRIVTEDLKGLIYIKTEPYSSHFHFDPRFEDFLKTLELNFFISKYNDMSDKDGSPVSIYCLNYGLCKKENLFWGKPNGTKYRKYFIERPFNYNKVISEFLSNSKRIVCSNPSCGKQFDIEQLEFIKFNNNKCNECHQEVVIETLDKNVREIIEKIDKSKMLPLPEVKILQELKNNVTDAFAREIAEEVDLSKYLVAARAKKLEEKHELVKRNKIAGQPYKYQLTDKGENYFTGE
ncbi:winged helix-turn-helix domain-containing protein [Flavobacterium sp. HBTb2-11-1]|uniref:winged helix-turn-helix domain-containing protein n=1 Tax=Flavobacterium sp. HBTb2-11-1 TaxID=2692212 RepID=UPI00136C66D0|nr:winged helix-turn-helix domain-containing protein [Flavobacterium sp. HBTb2-11-1]MXO04004.1 MarR family transcriptional regulator [Flavobacterium sp. HBTb2-11-1]